MEQGSCLSETVSVVLARCKVCPVFMGHTFAYINLRNIFGVDKYFIMRYHNNYRSRPIWFCRKYPSRKPGYRGVSLNEERHFFTSHFPQVVSRTNKIGRATSVVALDPFYAMAPPPVIM
jgi:hypothetical protein